MSNKNSNKQTAGQTSQGGQHATKESRGKCCSCDHCKCETKCDCNCC